MFQTQFSLHFNCFYCGARKKRHKL